MAGFLEPLAIREIPGDDRRWILMEPCRYYLKTLHGDEYVEAETHFVTDLGSIPRPLWWVPGLSPFGRLRRGYVIHDKLYQTPVVHHVNGGARAIGRDEADLILLEACIVLEANWLNRRVIYRGVRIGGEGAWNGHRDRDREEQLRHLFI
jgi:hypothetical protein